MKTIHSINWEITRKCNLNCIYCRVSGGLEKQDELTLEQAKDVVTKLTDSKYSHIKFTGGEPLIKKYFWDLVKFAHSKKMLVSLFTNATLVTDENIDLFKKYITSVAVSIDSLDVTQNIALGRSNVERIIRNVEKLKNAGVHTVLSTTITNINVNQIPSLIKLAQNLRIHEIKINDFVPNGRARDNENLLSLSHPLNTQKGILSDEIRKVYNEETKIDNRFMCECSDNDIFIRYNGDVYPCVELVYASEMFCLGNIKGDFKQLLKINKKFYSQIEHKDYCGYSYISSPHVSACLNRSECPISLTSYMFKAKHKVS